MKNFIVLTTFSLGLGFVLGISSPANASTFEKYNEWKEYPEEKFVDAEANFKIALEKLQKEYMDKGISKEDLYRAATAGMLEALNTSEHSWNTLLTPHELKEIQIDLSGQVSGIGIEMKFDSTTGYTQIIGIIPNSPSAKAGLKNGDQILNVDGKRFNGKQIHDVVAAIRGKIGDSISLKVLREDKIISVRLKREIVPWTPVELSKLDSSTQLLAIGHFSNDTPKLVEEKIEMINANGVKNLIIDLRNNSGGGFEKAVQTAELFIPKDKIIATTKDRDGKTQTFISKKGILKKDINLILVTNKATSSGAELFAGAIKDTFGSKSVGESTFGKWNAQSVETLPNGFAIKYSVMGFQSPQGHSYQNLGLKPDVEVSLPKDVEPKELRNKYEMPRLLEYDSQLKAAVELVRAT